MAVNLRAPFLCLQEAVKSMKTRGGGSIVNIGSVNAYVGLPNLGPYSVSKGGLMTMTRNAAVLLNRHRIRVNQINVGWTLTEGEHRVQLSDGNGPDWLDKVVPTWPFGRLLLPKDIALAAAYFASDDGALVTGTVMDLEQVPVGALVGVLSTISTLKTGEREHERKQRNSQRAQRAKNQKTKDQRPRTKNQEPRPRPRPRPKPHA